jgi:hypothetical protein
MEGSGCGKNYPGICLKGLRETTKALSGQLVTEPKFEIRYLLNTKQEY